MRDVALVALDRGRRADQIIIDAEFGEILESARLGMLTRDGRIGIAIALHGMKPMWLTRQFISDQADLARSIEQLEHKDGFREVAVLILKTAWMTDWAAATYMSIAERRRAGTRTERKDTTQPAMASAKDSFRIVELLRQRYRALPPGETNPGARADQKWVEERLGSKVKRDDFLDIRRENGFTPGRGRPRKSTK